MCVLGRVRRHSAVVIVLVLCASFAAADQWQSRDVDLQMGRGVKIKRILERPDAEPAMAADAPTVLQGAYASIIDSPPVDGFIPWIVVTTTDEREEELVLAAVPETGPVNNFTASSPTTDYAIGIFDTGASAHVMGYNAASTLRLWQSDLITDNTLAITGVNDWIDARVSYPLGLFIDGLYAVATSGLLADTSNMIGETNVSIIVGQSPEPNAPDLPTAIGTPLSVYYTAVINNDTTVEFNAPGIGNVTAPDIRFYEHGDAAIPQYTTRIPLELRPLGGLEVQYVPDYNLEELFLDPFAEIEFDKPSVPSTIIGQQSQSIFFVHSVDIKEGSYSANDKDRFMLDTGAQVSTIGYRMGARLGLNPNQPDFMVEIQGVTGEVTMEPGFYIDELNIPALGGWLNYTNVPVILIDVFSPEGGTLDGIIGMNLFTEFNMVLRGGGLFLTDDPSLELEYIGTPDVAGDIAPVGGDGEVNIADLAALGSAWLATPVSMNWLPAADLFADELINYRDFQILAANWGP